MEKSDISFFTSDELKEFSQDFKYIYSGRESATPTFIQTLVQLSNEYDDYLDSKVRKQLTAKLNKSEESLEIEALEFFQEELLNLRRAIDEANSISEWVSVIDICDSLVLFFNIRTYWEELEETLKIALNAAQKCDNKLAQARILNNLGHTFRLLGRAKDGKNYSIESCNIFRELQDIRGEAEALYTLGYLYRSLGCWSEAISSFTGCLSLFDSLNDTVGKASTLDGLGQVYTKQGNIDKAEEVLRQSLQIKEQLNDRFQISITCNNLGKVYVQQKRLSEAKKLFERSLAIKLEIGDRQGQGVSFNQLGEVCRLKGEFEEAFEYYQQSLKVKKQVSASENSAISDNHGEGLTLMNIGLLFQDKGELDKALIYWRQATEKLNVYSPEFKQVTKWLEQF